MTILLIVLLSISVILNGFQYYRWHSYRTKPAGTHSHTGMMPRISREMIEKDRDKGNS